jgi:release factor glutamine methyltransferase
VRLLPAEARLHEPRVALDGGPDGFDILRRVIVGALEWLAPGGHVLIETSDDQAAAATEAMRRSGLLPGVTTSDELNATVVIGTRPADRR